MSNYRRPQFNLNLNLNPYQNNYQPQYNNRRNNNSNKKISNSITKTKINIQRRDRSQEFPNQENSRQNINTKFSPSQEILTQLLSCESQFCYSVASCIKELANNRIGMEILKKIQFSNLLTNLIRMNKKFGGNPSNLAGDLKILLKDERRAFKILTTLQKITRKKWSTLGLRRLIETLCQCIEIKFGKKNLNRSANKKSPLQTRLSSYKKVKILNSGDKRSNKFIETPLKKYENEHEFVNEILKSKHMNSRKKNPLQTQFEDPQNKIHVFKSNNMRRMKQSSERFEVQNYQKNNFSRSPVLSKPRSRSPMSNIATAKKWIRTENSQKSITKLRPPITPPKSKITYPVYSPTPNTQIRYLSPSPYKQNLNLKIDKEVVRVSNSKQINHNNIPRTPSYKKILPHQQQSRSPLLKVSQSLKQITPNKGNYLRRSGSSKMIRSPMNQNPLKKIFTHSGNKVVISGAKVSRGVNQIPEEKFEKRFLKRECNIEKKQINFYNRKQVVRYARSVSKEEKVRKVIFDQNKKIEEKKSEIVKRINLLQSHNKNNDESDDEKSERFKNITIDSIRNMGKKVIEPKLESRKPSEGVITFQINSARNRNSEFENFEQNENFNRIQRNSCLHKKSPMIFEDRRISEQNKPQKIPFKEKNFLNNKNLVRQKEIQEALKAVEEKLLKATMPPESVTKTLTPPYSAMRNKIQRTLQGKNSTSTLRNSSKNFLHPKDSQNFQKENFESSLKNNSSFRSDLENEEDNIVESSYYEIRNSTMSMKKSGSSGYVRVIKPYKNQEFLVEGYKVDKKNSRRKNLGERSLKENTSNYSKISDSRTSFTESLVPKKSKDKSKYHHQSMYGGENSFSVENKESNRFSLQMSLKGNRRKTNIFVTEEDKIVEEVEEQSYREERSKRGATSFDDSERSFEEEQSRISDYHSSSRENDLATFRGDQGDAKTEKHSGRPEMNNFKILTVPGRELEINKRRKFQLDSNSILMNTDLSHQFAHEQEQVPSLDEIFLTGNHNYDSKHESNRTDDRDHLLKTGSSNNTDIHFNQEWEGKKLSKDILIRNSISKQESEDESIQQDRSKRTQNSEEENQNHAYYESESIFEGEKPLTPVLSNIQPSSYVDGSIFYSNNDFSSRTKTKIENSRRRVFMKKDLEIQLKHQNQNSINEYILASKERDNSSENSKPAFKISLLKKKEDKEVFEGWQTISGSKSPSKSRGSDIRLTRKDTPSKLIEGENLIELFNKKFLEEKRAKSMRMKPEDPEDSSASKSQNFQKVLSPDKFIEKNEISEEKLPRFPQIDDNIQIQKRIEYSPNEAAIDFTEKIHVTETRKSQKKFLQKSLVQSLESAEIRTISSKNTKDFPNLSEESFPFENIQNYQSKYKQLNFTYPISEITEKSNECSSRRRMLSSMKKQKKELFVKIDTKVSVVNYKYFEDPSAMCRINYSFSQPDIVLDNYLKNFGKNYLEKNYLKKFKHEHGSRKDCRNIRDCVHQSWNHHFNQRKIFSHKAMKESLASNASLQIQTNSFKSLNSKQGPPAGELLRVYIKERPKLSPKPNLPVSPSDISSYQEQTTVTFDASLNLKKKDVSISDFSESDKDEFNSRNGTIRNVKRRSLDSGMQKISARKFSSVQGNEIEAIGLERSIKCGGTLESNYSSFGKSNFFKKKEKIAEIVQNENQEDSDIPISFNQTPRNQNTDISKRSHNSQEYHPFVHLDNTNKSLNDSIYHSNSFDRLSSAKEGKREDTQKSVKTDNNNNYNTNDDLNDSIIFKEEEYTEQNPQKVENNSLPSILKESDENEEQKSFLTFSRNVPDFEGNERFYPPKDKTIVSLMEADSKFGVEPIGAAINVNQTNCYRIDIGLGGVLAYGGEFLSFAKEVHDPYSSGSSLRFIYTDENNRFPLIKVKILQEGNILYVDPLTHDAVKIDYQLKEISRNKGIPIPQSVIDSAPSFNKNRKTTFTDEKKSDFTLWLSGLNHISILNTKTMIAKEIQNFWRIGKIWCFALIAVADKHFEKLFGIGYNTKQEPTFHFCDTNEAIIRTGVLKEIIGEDKHMKEVRSLEVSYEQKVIFLGGGYDDDEGVARLMAISFNKDLKKITELTVKPDNMNCIYSMRRTEKGNVLFLGGFGSCTIVYFDSNSEKFEILNMFEDIMNDEISDMRYFRNSLYLISPAHEEIVKITFICGRESQASVINLKAPKELIGIFSRFSTKDYQFEEEIEWLEISKTGEIMYLRTKDALKIAPKDVKTGDYYMENIPESNLNCSILEEYQEKYFALTTKNENSFELYTYEMDPICKIPSQGSQKLTKRFSSLSQYHASKHDPNIFLWPMGDTKLCIIDLEMREFDIVDKLGGYTEMDNLSHCAVSCCNGRKVFSLTSEDKNYGCFLNFWTKGMETVATKSVKELDPGIKFLNSAEISNDSSIIFAIGHASIERNTAVLVAFSFDKYFDFISKITLSLKEGHSSIVSTGKKGINQAQEMTTENLKKNFGFTCIKKLKCLDVVLVAGGTKLGVYFFEKKKFSLLRNFDSIFEFSIERMSLWKNEVVILGDSGNKVKVFKFAQDVENYIFEL